MKFSFILAAFTFILWAHAQQAYQKEGSFKIGPAEDFTLDQFGNLYVIAGDELTKRDPAGKMIYSYSNPVLGDIHQVDVFNPLKPYVFFKNAHRIVILDNRLNENEEINLLDRGFTDVQFISFSDQQNVWLYDQAQDKLFRFNITDKKITNRSLNITQLLGSENQPRQMFSSVDNIYLNIPTRGIMVFDATGAYEKLLPITGIHDFEVKGGSLFGLKEGQLLIYNLNTSELMPVNIPEEKLVSLSFANNRLYLYDGRQLHRYFRPAR